MRTAPQPRPVGLLPLWIGLLTGPAMWTVHLFASYMLVPLSCSWHTNLLLNLTTLVTALATLGAGIVAFWAWRQTRVGGETALGSAAGRSGFMAIVGIAMSALFLAVILVEGIPPIFMDPCVFHGSIV